MSIILTMNCITVMQFQGGNNMIDKKTSITLNGTTKDLLANIGSKGDSYEDIVLGLFHQRNILMIHRYCGNTLFEDSKVEFTESVDDCFKDCNIPYPQYYLDNGLNGSDELEPFTEQVAINCMEMATDEDFIGHNRIGEVTLAEAVTNAYCLMYDIPSPTFSYGAMRNPFAP